MPNFEGQFFSIVFIGRHNPQILNHDFLVANDILPEDQAPFKQLFAKKDVQPFTEFISTPVITSIKYGAVSIVVEENRYQIIDNRLKNLPSSLIVQITQRYFGKFLRYTPLKLGGMNFNGLIHLEDMAAENSLDDKLGIVRKKLFEICDVTDVRVNVITFSFPWSNGTIEVQIAKSKEVLNQGTINFNYEFQYQDMDSFLGNLDIFEQFYDKFDNLLKSLDIRRE